MSLTNWMKHPHINRQEELLIHLYHLRVATKEQLAGVMGLKPSTISLYLYEINNGKAVRRKGRAKHHIERSEIKREQYRQKGLAIESIRSYLSTPAVYFLGARGLKTVSSILETKAAAPSFSHRHISHYLGINDILLRFIERVGLSTFAAKGDWWNTMEAYSQLQQFWLNTLARLVSIGKLSESLARQKIDSMPRPDAVILFNNKRAWLEYDNATENRSKLYQKMKDCIEYLSHFQEPIIWVCTRHKPRRAKYLEDVWHHVQHDHQGSHFPAMYFFTEGEEVSFLSHYFLH